MCYQCATNAENVILRAHYAYMAMRSGVTLERLVQIADETSTGGGDSAAEDAAMAFAQAARCVFGRRVRWQASGRARRHKGRCCVYLAQTGFFPSLGRLWC